MPPVTIRSALPCRSIVFFKKVEVCVSQRQNRQAETSRIGLVASSEANNFCHFLKCQYYKDQPEMVHDKRMTQAEILILS
jgi:hypothetical protein